MKKIILAKLAVHANPNRVVKEFTKKYGEGVFYDSDTHSIAKMEEEVVEKIVEKEEEKETLDEKDAENLLNQNTKTVKKALEEVSSVEDLAFLLETEKAGNNRKKVITAIEEKL